MKELRKYFRYRFPESLGDICADDSGHPLHPFDISHGGVAFYSGREFQVGSIEKIHLLEFLSLDVLVKFVQPAGEGAPPGADYKIGVEFVDFILSPQKLIEFLEIHLLHAPD